jgi:late competence protein required for DNA uptake (superfamily II DNA/RNA helicase)
MNETKVQILEKLKSLSFNERLILEMAKTILDKTEMEKIDTCDVFNNNELIEKNELKVVAKSKIFKEFKNETIECKKCHKKDFRKNMTMYKGNVYCAGIGKCIMDVKFVGERK